MNCVIYTRFSPRRNAADCESCEVQRGFCTDYASRHGWGVSAVYDDPDRSGADCFRQQLASAISALKKGDALLVYKMDRIARDLMYYLMVERDVKKRGARIVCVSGDIPGDDPNANFMRQIIAAAAEWERAMIGQRTRDAMLSHQREGRRMGGKVPYGYAVDPADPRRLVPCERERRAIATIAEMKRAGHSLREIATVLDPAAARSGRWHYEQLRRIVARLERDGEL